MPQRPQPTLFPLILPTHSTYYKSDDKGSDRALPPRTRAPFLRRNARWRNAFKLVALIVLCALLVLHLIPDPVGDWIKQHPHERLPPTYTAYKEREKALTPEKSGSRRHEKDTKYFFPARYVSDVGWGNAVQEIVLHALVAYASNRTFVWDDYLWSRRPDPYAIYNDRLIPAHIPLSVILGGSLMGELQGEKTFKAVPRPYFEKICPSLGGVEYINVDDLNAPLRHDENVGALEILQTWMDKLDSTDAACVSNAGSPYQMWEMWIFGSRRIWDLWPMLLESPIISGYSSSPLILLGLEANKDLLGVARLPALAHLPAPISFSAGSNPDISQSSLKILRDEQFDVIPGLLVLHIRRGDFEQHCQHLATWTAGWQGMNDLAADGLPDTLEPREPLPGNLTDYNSALYGRRCYPEIPQIVRRVEEIRREYPKLGRVYVMTNGKREWILKLQGALFEDSERHPSGPWQDVTSSRDLSLDWEQKYVAQAVDMAIGTRADVLLGNGWSSLTSHLTMLRMGKGFPRESNRFW